jgi:hypothetical protein
MQSPAAFSTKNYNRGRPSIDRHPGQAARCTR